MLTIDDDLLAARVRNTVGELIQGAEQLKGLAVTLDGFSSLTATAEPDEIKQVAIGVRATAVQAMLVASTAIGLSERLAIVATVLDHAEDAPEPKS